MGRHLQELTIPLFKVFMAPSVEAAVTSVLYSGFVGEGEEVKAFERELGARLGVTRVVSVNSCTSALHLACHMSLDGSAAAEIITTPMTCIATNSSVVRNGARIVWADIDPLTGNIDPDEIEPLINERTRAIMMVHWGGNPCEIDRICKIGHAHGIPVIEDAAHALGATYRGRPIGQHSDLIVFSFQAVKHVTAVDGGCLVCKDVNDDARARLLRWYGVGREYSEPTDLRCEIDVAEAGYKFHMNNVAAAIGRENLKHLDWMLTRHRDNARFTMPRFASRTASRSRPRIRTARRLAGFTRFTSPTATSSCISCSNRASERQRSMPATTPTRPSRRSGDHCRTAKRSTARTSASRSDGGCRRRTANVWRKPSSSTPDRGVA